MKTENLLYRLLVYLVGMTMLACGLTLTAETNLGTSALTAIPFVVSVYTGISFPNATLGMFVVFVVLQILIKWKKSSLILLLLQLPLSVVFTRIMGIAQRAIDISDYNFFVRLLFLFLAILLTGAGASLGLRMWLIPNAGDGFVHSLSERLDKPLGNVKNAVDISCVGISVVLSWVLMRKVVGFGIGSILVMLGVGRVIAVADRLYEKWGIPKY
ncbi:MAG: DUF6198 family protein [Clostridiales bacterium]|nr:DUF6198 family protein [Clostridiales bacterium]